MTIITIITENPSQPVEVQTWLNENQDITVSKMFVQGNIFYIVY